jgi:hypothetical protein
MPMNLSLGLGLGGIPVSEGVGGIIKVPSQDIIGPYVVGGSGGWSQAFGSIAVDSDNVRVAGVPVLTVTDPQTTGNVGYVLIKRKITAAEVAAGKIEIWVYIPETAGNSSFNLHVSSDTPSNDPPTGTALPTNRRSVAFGPGYFVRDAWNCVTIPIDSAVAAPVTWTNTGSPDASAIRSIFIECNFASAGVTGQRFMRFSDIAMGGRSVSLVSFTFDGYLTSTVGYALPKLAAYGWNGSFFIDGELISSNLAGLNTLNSAGWDIGNNGRYHTDYFSSPSGFSADWDFADGELAANGFNRGRSLFAWPSAVSTADLRSQLVAKGGKWGRDGSFIRTPYTSKGRDVLVNAGAFDCGAQTSTAMKNQLAEAVKCGDPLTYLFHELIPGASPTSLQTANASFDLLLVELAVQEAAGTVRVVTPSQALTLMGVT